MFVWDTLLNWPGIFEWGAGGLEAEDEETEEKQKKMKQRRGKEDNVAKC